MSARISITSGFEALVCPNTCRLNEAIVISSDGGAGGKSGGELGEVDGYTQLTRKMRVRTTTYLSNFACFMTTPSLTCSSARITGQNVSSL